jgi:hypothetical protein
VVASGHALKSESEEGFAMDKSIVKQYRAHIELADGSVYAAGGSPAAIVGDLTCDNLEVLKERITLLGGKAKFEGTQSTAGSPGVTLIFHPNWNRGQSPLGCISPFEVHESMTVGNTIERLKEAAA